MVKPLQMKLFRPTHKLKKSSSRWISPASSTSNELGIRIESSTRIETDGPLTPFSQASSPSPNTSFSSHTEATRGRAGLANSYENSQSSPSAVAGNVFKQPSPEIPLTPNLSGENGRGEPTHSPRRHRWPRRMFGSMDTQEQETDSELGIMIKRATDVSLGNGSSASSVSERANLLRGVCAIGMANENAAKEAVRCIGEQLKWHEDPLVRLNTVRLLSIMLKEASDTFMIQAASRGFLGILEDIISSPLTSNTLRERLLDFLAVAAQLHGEKRDGEGFLKTWRRLRPIEKLFEASTKEGIHQDIPRVLDGSFINTSSPPVSEADILFRTYTFPRVSPLRRPKKPGYEELGPDSAYLQPTDTVEAWDKHESYKLRREWFVSEPPGADNEEYRNLDGVVEMDDVLSNNATSRSWPFVADGTPSRPSSPGTRSHSPYTNLMGYGKSFAQDSSRVEVGTDEGFGEDAHGENDWTDFMSLYQADPTPNLETLMMNHTPLDLSGQVIIPDRSNPAHGGLADVHAGLWNDKEVAVKVLRIRKSRRADADWEASNDRRINREMHVWSALKHPNISEFLGYSTDFSDYPAMVSMWYKRGTATEYLEQQELPLNKRIRLAQDVSKGLRFLHQLKIVHGDLKPSNVLVDDAGVARLCDFGLVRLVDWEGPAGMTTTSPYMGTERYKAPELFISADNRHPVATFQGDVYSLGCIMLEFIEMLYPFQRFRKTHELRNAIMDGYPPALRSEATKSLLDGGDGLWNLFEVCWDEPSERPGIGIIVEALDFFAQTLPS